MDHKEKMHKKIMKYEIVDSQAKDHITLYDLIESVCGKQAEKYYNACLRRGINSVRQLINLFVYQENDSIEIFFKGSYCGPKGISILKECVDWYIDYVPYNLD